MNTVTDLSARTLSFIILKQDLYLSGDSKLMAENKTMFDVVSAAHTMNYFSPMLEAMESGQSSARDKDFINRAAELVWISTDRENKAEAAGYAAYLCDELAKWLRGNQHKESFKELRDSTGIPAPNAWRTAISNLLYEEPKQRSSLSKTLHYLPLQVVLAIGGSERDAHGQRVMQAWHFSIDDKPEENVSPETKKPVTKPHLNKEEETFCNSSVTETNEAKKREEISKLEELLEYDSHLIKKLLTAENPSPLSFELLFNNELDQVANSRKKREEEQCLQHDSPKKEEHKNNGRQDKTDKLHHNPYNRAKDMRLRALAISGGGIRSATFNLGIIQGLAKNNILPQIDYLSSVSGGGYIGSWLATWIKRKGSVTEVADRLNPDKSPDPFADEVRPIRWLRMFSNYLNPDSGIMSVDSWTVGTTFLRNTLVNMIIILLLIISLLFAGRFLFVAWDAMTSAEGRWIYYVWAFLLLLISLVTGIGMRAYTRQITEEANTKEEGEKSGPGLFFERIFSFLYYYVSKGSIISNSVALITLAGAYMISAWFYANSGVSNKFYRLWIPGVLNIGALLLTARFGGYDKCIISFLKYKKKNVLSGKGKTALHAWVIIIIASVIASAMGIGALALVWQGIGWIHTHSFFSSRFHNNLDSIRIFRDKVAFTFTIPVLLVAFGVTIVARMALLGNYFPDERREWWGRMGAIVNRNALLWFIVAGSALLGAQTLNDLAQTKTGIATPLGAWMALVGAAVKTAFSSLTTGDKKKTGFMSILTDVLGKFGPYLFILGLLFFAPGLLSPIENLGVKAIDKVSSVVGHPVKLDITRNGSHMFLLSVLIVVISLCTYGLSRRVGVNEFSMHHFYRNRLVRAYLGATRRRAERTKTENVFTHFDMKDDEKLSSFTFENQYYGPYPVLNTALNVSSRMELDRQDRKAESFTFSPLYCGFDFSTTKASASLYKKYYDYGYRPTWQYAYSDDRGPSIGTAMAISGAAANPNQGYHSSPATAFLLTVFNVRLGWWIGNPRKGKWRNHDPKHGLLYLVSDLAGSTNTESDYICLSDGGHFDNMGLYEMIRRRCRFIIVGDGEQDENFTCEGLANAIRRCLIDFGAAIDIDVCDIVKRDEKKVSKKQYAIGTIHYPDDAEPGILLYIKSSLNGEEPVDVREYGLKNPAFPHQSTGDQFFTEDQFESYRKLGLYIVDTIMKEEKSLDKMRQKALMNISANNKKGDAGSDYKNAVKRISERFMHLFPVIK